MGAARRGVSTVVERIDPGVLADLIIKSTALQEMTNTSLREKQSPYRIAEVNITASIPPGITFSISRMDDKDEVVTGGDGLVRRPSRRVWTTAARRSSPSTARASARSSWPRSGRPSRTRCPRTSTASEHRLDVLDRARRPLARRALGDLDAARRQRARARRSGSRASRAAPHR